MKIITNIICSFSISDRRIGENDSYVLQLIREDSIKEFIIYVNKTNLQLDSQITPSIFETNPFMFSNSIKLIEYAAFYGLKTFFVIEFEYLQIMLN